MSLPGSSQDLLFAAGTELPDLLPDDGLWSGDLSLVQ